MKAIRVHETGTVDALRYEDIALPEPPPGSVRLKIEAIGVNFIDIYKRTGQYKMPLPFTPGDEAAGTVDAVGEGVNQFKPGDRVAYAFGVGGAYAEYAISPVEKLVAIPEGLDARLAAAVLLQGMTAHYLTHDTFPIQVGQTVLVVQIAKLRGARVIGTVSTREKAQIARECGADDVILYSEQDFEAEVKRLTGGKGVDAVYDSVGKDTFDRSMNCLRPRGYLVLFGQSSGSVAPVDPQVLNAKGSLFLTRPSLGAYTLTYEELQRRAGDVLGWVRTGKLRVRIDREFPLREAGPAHAALANRESKGKLILLP
jgi:NADPH2:quinone reductase